MGRNLFGHGTDILSNEVTVVGLSFSDEQMTVNLTDGRAITVPLAWYPRLQKATHAQRAHWEPCGAGSGIHWPEVDEDLSIEGMLRGIPSAEYRKQRLEVRN